MAETTAQVSAGKLTRRIRPPLEKGGRGQQAWFIFLELALASLIEKLTPLPEPSAIAKAFEHSQEVSALSLLDIRLP